MPHRLGKHLHFEVVSASTKVHLRKQLHRIGPEPALRIRHRCPTLKLDPKVGKLPPKTTSAWHIWNREIARTNHDTFWMFSKRGEENGQIIRVMLSIGIDANHPYCAPLPEMLQSGE